MPDPAPVTTTMPRDLGLAPMTAVSRTRRPLALSSGQSPGAARTRRSFVIPLALVTAWVTLLAGVPGSRAAPAKDVNSLGLTATYDVEATFGWDERTADVHTEIAVSNRVRWPVSTIAFNL